MSATPLKLALAAALLPFATAAFADDSIRLDTGRSDRTPYEQVRKDSDTVAIREGAVQSGNNGQHTQAPGIASDGEALGLLIAINDHQIETAELAQKKGVSPALQEFARDVESDYRANQKKTRRVGEQAGVNPFESDDVVVVRQRAAAERNMLESLSGAEFELAFIDAMVQINADAMTAIDQSLMPASKDPGVQDHLRAARERFAGNLTRANGFLPPTAAR